MAKLQREVNGIWAADHSRNYHESSILRFSPLLNFLLLHMQLGSLVRELHPDSDYFYAGLRFLLDAFEVFLAFRGKEEDFGCQYNPSSCLLWRWSRNISRRFVDNRQISFIFFTIQYSYKYVHRSVSNLNEMPEYENVFTC